MGIKYRKFGVTFETLGYTSRITTPSLCYRKNGITYYVPLLLNGDPIIVDGYEYKASSIFLICCRYNGNTYKAATSRETFTPDIPAGTYTPTDFENLIKQFISNNGTRITANSFTLKVNNQTITVNAGQVVNYRTSAAGSGTNSSLRAVTFNGQTVVAALDALNFRGSYVTYATNYSGNCTWSGWQYYSITVGAPGIKFV